MVLSVSYGCRGYHILIGLIAVRIASDGVKVVVSSWIRCLTRVNLPKVLGPSTTVRVLTNDWLIHLVVATSTSTNVVLPLVVVDGTEVLGACHTARSLCCSREASSFAIVSFVCGCLGLRMHAQLLVEHIGLQRWDEALLFHSDRIGLHWACYAMRSRSSTSVNGVHILEQVSNHGVPKVGSRLVLDHIKRHGCEYLAALSVVLVTVPSLVLDASRRSVVWAYVFWDQIVLIGWRH